MLNIKKGIFPISDIEVVTPHFLKTMLLNSYWELTKEIKNANYTEYTTKSPQCIAGKPFSITLTFINDDIVNMKLYSPTPLVKDNVINMKAYFEYLDSINEWAMKLFEKSGYVQKFDRTIWDFDWGTVSVPSKANAYTGEAVVFSFERGN